MIETDFGGTKNYKIATHTEIGIWTAFSINIETETKPEPNARNLRGLQPWSRSWATAKSGLFFSGEKKKPNLTRPIKKLLTDQIEKLFPLKIDTEPNRL